MLRQGAPPPPFPHLPPPRRQGPPPRPNVGYEEVMTLFDGSRPILGRWEEGIQAVQTNPTDGL
eukprot:7841994-Pyramimonas_sp.AAC.1